MSLDERIVNELKTLHGKLSAEGKLLSLAQLDQCYDRFRQRFGPAALKALDGEMLLETMHDHSNRDSLVYWLEFKDDEEFPARFGSIAGGSALKFGVFRRRETGAWATGDAQNYPVDIPMSQAVEIARKHRDQLLTGVELLERLPENGTDADYAVLQQGMDTNAPEVSDLAWGHKYFSLLFPRTLDDYHVPRYQRFHLIKLLQPPPPSDGRYLPAGRFMEIARELEMHPNHLTGILNDRDGRPYRYWRIGTSDGTTPRNRWALMRDGACVAVGWSELGDLSAYEANQEGKAAITSLMKQHFPGDQRLVGKKGAEVFRFVTAIEEGDLVLPSDGGRVLGIGRVTGGYRFDSSPDFRHRRPVEWLSLDEWDMPTPEGLRTTVFELGKNPANLLEVERQVLDGHASGALLLGSAPTPHSLPGIPGRIQAILERKGQVILYGPPGTGKTYWARRAAVELAGSGGANGATSVRMCTFHPEYGYEDFIEGYRPEVVAGQLSFVLRDGLFKAICGEAEANPQVSYYLIIDEINRGDIPRIFGELLTLLEKDKRGQPIVLALSRAELRVPQNLYVLGTMNTADRSIALLDTALRRRFGFVELMPDSSVLGDATVEGIPLAPWLDSLNRRIREYVGRDARNLQVGHAYLLEDGQPVKTWARFTRILRDDILPLVEEYCYEDYAVLERLLGDSLVNASAQDIRWELFEPAREKELVQALLKPDPGVATSRQALISPDRGAAEEAEDETGGEVEG